MSDVSRGHPTSRHSHPRFNMNECTASDIVTSQTDAAHGEYSRILVQARHSRQSYSKTFIALIGNNIIPAAIDASKIKNTGYVYLKITRLALTHGDQFLCSCRMNQIGRA